MRLLVLGLLAVTACATTGPKSFTRPELAERAFHEARTPHITLVTDLDKGDAEDEVRKLEERWLMLADHYELVAPGQPRPAEPFQVLIFARCRDFEVFTRTENTAGFVVTSRDHRDRALMVTCARNDTSFDRLFLHELSHAFNHHFFPLLPTWLEEGLASFYETLQISANTAVIGEIPLVALAFRPQSSARIVGIGDKGGRMPTFDELLEMTPREFYGNAAGGGPSRHYAAAWALVHLLNSSQALQDQFVLYLSHLSVGRPVDEAWDANYGNLPRAKLAAELDGYIARSELRTWRARYTRPKTPAATVRRLGAGETHAIWAHLLLMAKADLGPVHVYAQLDFADAADPTWARRHFWRAMAQEVYGDPDVDALLRKAADLDPGDPLPRLAIVTRAVASNDDAALAEVTPYAEQLEQDAKTGREFAALAFFWLRRGAVPRAMPLAVRAVQVEKGCAYCFEALAFTLATTGKFDQAAIYQTRAVGLLERHERAADSSAARARLDRYRSQATEKR